MHDLELEHEHAHIILHAARIIMCARKLTDHVTITRYLKLQSSKYEQQWAGQLADRACVILTLLYHTRRRLQRLYRFYVALIKLAVIKDYLKIWVFKELFCGVRFLLTPVTLPSSHQPS